MIWSQKLCKWLPRPAWMSAKVYARLPHIVAVAGSCMAAPLLGYSSMPLAPRDRPAPVHVSRPTAGYGAPLYLPPMRSQPPIYTPPPVYLPPPEPPIYTMPPATPVPEPGSLALLATACALLFMLSRARRRPKPSR